jgi:septum formation protein
MRKERLILASSSPRRAALLRQIGFAFEVIPSGIDEELNGCNSPVQSVLHLSERKARRVAEQARSGIIVGADTVVILDGHRLGKPRDRQEAKDMLWRLSGKEHLVYTGFTLLHVPSERETSDYEVTRVKFRPLEEDEVHSYVRSGSSLDKAGAYGIQDDYGAVFVERIDGCYYNVMGFPLTKFYLSWKEFVRSLHK